MDGHLDSIEWSVDMDGHSFFQIYDVFPRNINMPTIRIYFQEEFARFLWGLKGKPGQLPSLRGAMPLSRKPERRFLQNEERTSENHLGSSGFQ